jgi:hypothetical protein
MIFASAYGAGQLFGVLLLVTIVGFAVRDQRRKRQGR